MTNRDLLKRIVVVPPHDYVRTEKIMCLADYDHDGRMFLVDYDGNTLTCWDCEGFILTEATPMQVAEEFLQGAGFRGRLSELPNEAKRDELVARIYEDVKERFRVITQGYDFGH